jgi:ABC-2 type transport system ATP-binding protein
MRSNPDGPAVIFSGVSKSYGAVRAVDDLTLTIPRGETVAMLGPNGAGKSTSINMMLGLFPADAGTIEVFGSSPAAAGTAGRVGAMLQESQLVPRVKVAELLNFVRGLYREPMPLDEVLAIANLDDLAGRRLEKLSGGQSQRVRFAVAIAGQPDLLVLDEPTEGLDGAGRRLVGDLITEYRHLGRAVVLISHVLTDAERLCDRIAVLAEGRAVFDGPLADLIRDPATGAVRPLEQSMGDLFRRPAA